jgi:hypothetical protein
VTAIYTAVCGGYDELPTHPPIEGVEFIAFCDEPVESDLWEVRPFENKLGHPRMAAKVAKVFPWLLLPEHEHTIWIDASHEITTPDFAWRTISAINETGLALYQHPWRDCIYEEAEASLKLEKYQGLPIEAQVDSYRAEGHPEHFGLYACGTLARRDTPSLRSLMEAWWAEIDAWTYQDQLSLPVVCRRQGVKPATFPVHQVWGNSWHLIHPHKRDD